MEGIAGMSTVLQRPVVTGAAVRWGELKETGALMLPRLSATDCGIWCVMPVPTPDPPLHR